MSDEQQPKSFADYKEISEVIAEHEKNPERKIRLDEARQRLLEKLRGKYKGRFTPSANLNSTNDADQI